MKYLLLFLIIFIQSAVLAKEQFEAEDRELVLSLVQEVKGYFNTDKGCKPRYSFKERKYLVDEFLLIKDAEIKSILYSNANELGIYLERIKLGSSGLYLEIYLKEGQCNEFDIFEVMH